MDEREAEIIYEAGKKAVVKALLEMDLRTKALEEQVLALTKKIASLSSNSTNSSKPPSSDGPCVAKSKKRKSRRAVTNAFTLATSCVSKEVETPIWLYAGINCCCNWSSWGPI